MRKYGVFTVSWFESHVELNWKQKGKGLFPTYGALTGRNCPVFNEAFKRTIVFHASNIVRKRVPNTGSLVGEGVFPMFDSSDIIYHTIQDTRYIAGNFRVFWLLIL